MHRGSISSCTGWCPKLAHKVIVIILALEAGSAHLSVQVVVRDIASSSCLRDLRVSVCVMIA